MVVHATNEIHEEGDSRNAGLAAAREGDNGVVRGMPVESGCGK